MAEEGADMSEWISVKDGLPNESLVGQEVVVCIRVRRAPFFRVTTANWWGGSCHTKKNAIWPSVAYWMPLPEPPKEE